MSKGGGSDVEGGETRAEAEGGETGEGAGEGLERVSVHILWPRDMDHGACELSQVGEMALLMGSPWQRHSKQSMSEWFVVSENSKFSTF